MYETLKVLTQKYDRIKYHSDTMGTVSEQAEFLSSVINLLKGEALEIEDDFFSISESLTKAQNAIKEALGE